MIETFYIYADGSDLDDIAAVLRARIEAFIAPYGGRVRVVDQREERKEESADWPDWDLGVNFEFETLSDTEKKDLLLFFQSLSAEFGRDFIVGGVLPSGQTEDLLSVAAGETLDQAFDLLLTHEKKG
ncbi:hypothetical protein ESB00_07060 [Oleiharenicola lentus]|uniref:Uncharacterized protein n=1 Tax=Oleiharenicola lentus TaxID=2508720 RepID=A0A4Q1C9S7_9BACT|nr:hypothetical protein [Oleiharenicola lentus]RXK55640.1 hypothetical protein ESB00_07060 [Oleiharenicola lentus]